MVTCMGVFLDIETYKVDTEMNKITVTGNVTAEQVLRVLQKIGKSATYWSQEGKQDELGI